ncbi:hypothetical protein AD428_18170 [Achromobacter sp. DMS1]|uniref:hypothetical protein n=1 Tax=Achromobacter sp. DMS1 TaxID=1688405 RepID=UPI00069F97DD|nr:hypothetical protein [Achromobacter sp. DMS1]KOF52761.1 hypothetical protein AD428_18170 [Achromobacter sp. DMS1]
MVALPPAALLALAPLRQRESVIEGHHDGEPVGKRHLGPIVLGQEIARIVGQHHVDAAQRVVHGGAALRSLQPVADEFARQAVDAVVAQRVALARLLRIDQEGFDQRRFLRRQPAQRAGLLLQRAQRALVAAASRKISHDTDGRPSQDRQQERQTQDFHCEPSFFGKAGS